MKQVGFGAVLKFDVEGEDSLRRSRDRLGEVDQTAGSLSSRLDTLSAGFAQVGAVGVGVGTAIVAGLTQTVRETASLEHAVAEVQTLLDPGTIWTREQITEVSSRLSRELGKPAEEVAGAFYQTLSASIAEGDAEHVLEEGLKLSVAGNADATIAIKAVAAALNSWQLGAEDAAHVTDQLMGIVKAGQTDLTLFGGNLGKVSKIAFEHGINLAEVGAYVARSTQSGLSTEESITGMRATIAAIGKVKKTKEAQDEIAKLGVQFDTAALRAKGIVGVMGDVSDAMDRLGYTTDERTDSFKKLVAEQAAQATSIALLNSKEREAYTDLMYWLERGVDGRRDYALGLMMDTTESRWSRTKEKFNDLKREVGEDLLPAANDIADDLNGVLEVLNSFAEGSPDAWNFGVKQTARLGGMTGALGGVALGAAAITKVLAMLGGTAGFTTLWGSAVVGVTAVGAAFTGGLLVAAGVGVMGTIDLMETLRDEAFDTEQSIAAIGEAYVELGRRAKEAFGISTTDPLLEEVARREKRQSGPAMNFYGAFLDQGLLDYMGGTYLGDKLDNYERDTKALRESLKPEVLNRAFAPGWQSAQSIDELRSRMRQANQTRTDMGYGAAFTDDEIATVLARGRDKGLPESVLRTGGGEFRGAGATGSWEPAPETKVEIPQNITLNMNDEVLAQGVARVMVTLLGRAGINITPEQLAAADLGVLPTGQ